jgi:ribonuclease BN (tRNA processing enzyme)
LKAIKAEAQALMMTHTGRAYSTIPKSRWPRAIAALRPETVTIYEDGINILMKPEFDGG